MPVVVLVRWCEFGDWDVIGVIVYSVEVEGLALVDIGLGIRVEETGRNERSGSRVTKVYIY